MKCFWCGERLKFETGKGWLHLDGQVYKTVVRGGGATRDFHYIWAVPDDVPTYKEYEGREEDYCSCLTGCEVCGGVPVHYWLEEEKHGP